MEGNYLQEKRGSNPMRWIAASIIALAFLALTPAMAAAGNHVGDAAPLQYEIVYLNPSGTLTINETGATYYFPRWNWTVNEGGVYDVKYFGTYPVYFIADLMKFEVRLKNTTNRTYKNLRVVVTQEYYLAEGATEGEKMPEEWPQYNIGAWTVSELRPGQEVVLQGQHFAGIDTRPGLDQTHLQVYHWSNGQQQEVQLARKTPGRLIVDDPTAGLYCPPAFVVF